MGPPIEDLALCPLASMPSLQRVEPNQKAAANRFNESHCGPLRLSTAPRYCGAVTQVPYFVTSNTRFANDGPNEPFATTPV